MPSSSKRCEYGDLVMQTVFTVFEENNYRDWLEQTFQATFSQVTDCLRWAGQPAELRRVRCV